MSEKSTEYCSNKHNFKLSNAVLRVNNSKKELGIKKFELPKVKINLEVASENQYHTSRESFHYFIKGGEINHKLPSMNKSQDNDTSHTLKKNNLCESKDNTNSINSDANHLLKP